MNDMISAAQERVPHLVDTTLRDGEQTPGVAFSVDDKVTIAGALTDIGIPEIEVGTPAMGGQETLAIQEVVRLQLPCRLTAWCRAREDDIQAAAACAVDAVHISFPTSDILLQTIGKDRGWVINSMEQLVSVARQHFDFVSIGAQDASRTKLAFLAQVAQVARDAGADRLRVADTVGIWTPFQTCDTLRRLRESVTRIELGFHGHNDLGLATANSLAAATGGAESVDVTVCGLGERAGNAALEQLVMAWRLGDHIECGIHTDLLGPLCQLVASRSNLAIPAHQPIVGERVFTHESGIHVHAMQQDRRSYEPFAASDVGAANTRFVIGKHSGKSAMQLVRNACCH